MTAKKKRKLKLTAIFRGTVQDGIDHWTDYAITKDIPLTPEQEKLLAGSARESFSELILEDVEQKTEGEKHGED